MKSCASRNKMEQGENGGLYIRSPYAPPMETLQPQRLRGFLLPFGAKKGQIDGKKNPVREEISAGLSGTPKEYKMGLL